MSLNLASAYVTIAHRSAARETDDAALARWSRKSAARAGACAVNGTGPQGLSSSSARLLFVARSFFKSLRFSLALSSPPTDPTLLWSCSGD